MAGGLDCQLAKDGDVSSSDVALGIHFNCNDVSCCCAVQSGLSRLAEAAKTIDELGQQAQLQRALLAKKQEEADRALADIQVGLAWAVFVCLHTWRG